MYLYIIITITHLWPTKPNDLTTDNPIHKIIVSMNKFVCSLAHRVTHSLLSSLNNCKYCMRWRGPVRLYRQEVQIWNPLNPSLSVRLSVCGKYGLGYYMCCMAVIASLTRTNTTWRNTLYMVIWDIHRGLQQCVPPYKKCLVGRSVGTMNG